MDYRALERWRAEQERASGKREASIVERLTSEWFNEEREFFDDEGQLGAACCGRRAGKTRGLVRDLTRDLLTSKTKRGTNGKLYEGHGFEGI